MNLLAIDTSSEACVVGLALGDEFLQRSEIVPRGHAERLLPWVGDLLAQAGLGLSGLDAIAYGRGPGSFTSLRIGIGVVQGLAFGADLPVAPVSSLAAIAEAGLEAIRGAGEGAPQTAVVAMDARLGEVFTARFRAPAGSSVTEASPERLETPAAAAGRIRDGDALLGNGFERCPALAALLGGERLGRVDTLPTAPALLRLARRWLEDNPGLPAERAQPVYLREQVADKPAKN